MEDAAHSSAIIQDAEEKWGALGDGPAFAKAFAMHFYGDLPLGIFKRYRRHGITIHCSEKEFQEILRLVMELKALESNCVGARNLLEYIRGEWAEGERWHLNFGLGREPFSDKIKSLIKRLWNEWFNGEQTQEILQKRFSDILAAV